MLALIFSISACSDSSLVPNIQKQSKKQAISKIDGKPILKISSADLYQTNLFNNIRNKLASKDGRVILHALKKKAASLNKQQTPSVAVMNLKSYAQPVVAGSKAGGQAVANTVSLADIGSELQIQDADGQVEDFVLTLQPYNPNPAQESGKQLVAGMVAGKANVAANNDTYLALDPDFFYIHDNANGEENWPVTFAATSLTDGSQIMITTALNTYGKAIYHFDYSGSSKSTALSKVTVGGSQPNLIFLTATPVIHPNVIHPCEEGEPCHQPPPPPGSGGGSGGGSGDGGLCQKVYDRGSSGVAPQEGDTFVDLYLVHLWADGDAGDGAELQMFVEGNDNYNKCFPQKYKYRFDKVVRPPAGIYSTLITGADNGPSDLGVYYAVPDINNERVDYPFLHVAYGTVDGAFIFHRTGYSKGFPLFDLTNLSIPFRLVLSDDDKDYPHFSRNHTASGPDNTYAEDIHTFDMSTGTWSEVNTGFTVNTHKNGNSDDPLTGSGVRRITNYNISHHLQHISGVGQAVKAKKYYSGRGLYFEYQFGLQVE